MLRLEHSSTAEPGNFSGQVAQCQVLSRAAAAGRPDLGELEPGTAAEVNLHVRIREMSARGGTWISRRNLTLYINKDNGLLPRRAEELTQSSLQRCETLCPVEVEGDPSEMWMGPGLLHHPPGLSLLNRGQPWNIGDISSNNHGDTLERKSQIRRSWHLSHMSHVTCA